MPNPIVHFEVMGRNLDALKAFYTGLFGWHSEDWPMPNGTNYVGIDTHAGGINGGLVAIPDEATPAATCYIAVEDPAATLKKIESLGGQTLVPVTDVGMVVFAVFMDPQGHPVGLVKADDSTQPQEAPKPPTEGAVGWFQLMGPDGPKLQDFYRSAFGWEIDTHDESGYGEVDTKAGGIGAGIGQDPEGQGHVTFFIQTADITAKLKAIEAAGGKTLMPETDMGGVVFGMFTDPDGCLVGLYKG
ncbi:MAG: VOC family protein [Chloroflexota bacterium]